MEKRIETKADEMLMRIRREGKMNILELEESLQIDRATVELWTSIFEAQGLVDIVYPANPIEPAYVVIKEKKKRGTATKV